MNLFDFLSKKIDKNELCIPSSGSTDHSRSTDEVLQTSWSRTLMLARFAVLHSTCTLLCQLVLYLLACRWKFGPLFQIHGKDFTNQQGYTCIIVNRSCPHVCIPFCVRTFTKHSWNLELQHCFTSGLFLKLLKMCLAWLDLDLRAPTHLPMNPVLHCMYCLVQSTTNVVKVVGHSAGTCSTVLEDAVMAFLQWWELWRTVSASGPGRQHSLMHAPIETNCFSTEWSIWTCSHENQHMLSPQLAPFARGGLLNRHQGCERQICSLSTLITGEDIPLCV